MKHGMIGTPTYNSWCAMKARCDSPTATSYRNYGARGISYPQDWKTFEGFLSDMGVRPEGTSLGRKNNDQNYSKENCKWETAEEQGFNKRTTRHLTFDGKTQALSQWAEQEGLNVTTLSYRLSSGWPMEDALFTPLGQIRRNCVWVSFEGRTDNLSGWSKSLGITVAALRKRLKNWPLERALS